MQKQRLEGLDVLRGFAALAIVFAHTVLLSHNPVPAGSAQSAHALTLAVPMFFALSAFSLAYKYFGKLHTKEDIREYALRRYFRIAPLFYFVIALWMVRGLIKWNYLPPTRDLLLNVSFLFGFSPTDYNSLVPAGWSLGVEMIFYATLPLLFFVIRGVVGGLVATAIALGAGYAVYLVTLDLHTSFKILNVVSSSANFMAGLAAYFAFKELSKVSAENHWRLSMFFLGAALAVWLGVHLKPDALGVVGSYNWRYFISAAFPLLILSAALAKWPVIANRATVYVGTISYSIYLLHPLILALLVPVRDEIYAAFPGAVWTPFLISTSLVYASVLACAAVSYHLIEKPGEKFGRWLSRLQPRLAPAE